MKTTITMIAVALGLAFTVPAFAGPAAPATKADCEKAGMKWNATTNKCEKGM
jgi:hypothetical protein